MLKNNLSIFFGIFLVSIIIIPSMGQAFAIPTTLDYKEYTSDDNRFTIEYPGNWLKGADGLGHIDSEIAFSDKADWNVMTQVFFYDGDTPDDRTDYQVLKQIVYNDSEICEDATFALDDRICYDYEKIDSYTMEAFNGNKIYFVKSSYTLEFDDPSYPGEYPMITTLGLVYGKDGSWEINIESDDFAFAKNSDEIIHMMKSFSIKEAALESVVIPDWIKTTAGWWCHNEIEDSSFIEALQYLIKNNVIVVSATSGTGSTDEVPDWIKNNACWWSEGQIDDNTFANGIKYLIENGIVIV